MVINRKVLTIEPQDKGWIALRLECGHVVSLHPSVDETSEQKAARFQDYIGELTPCKNCMRRPDIPTPREHQQAYQHSYYKAVTKPRRRQGN